MSATKDDIENVAAWAEVIVDMMYCVPSELREVVIKLAQERQREELMKPLFYRISDVDLNTPEIQNWHTIVRLKALLIQVFTRDITNNHSDKEAAKILFAKQHYGTGNGCLLDYIGKLLKRVVEAESIERQE